MVCPNLRYKEESMKAYDLLAQTPCYTRIEGSVSQEEQWPSRQRSLGPRHANPRPHRSSALSQRSGRAYRSRPPSEIPRRCTSLLVTHYMTAVSTPTLAGLTRPAHFASSPPAYPAAY